MELVVTSTQIEGVAYTTITHVHGDTFDPERLVVTAGGSKVFERGTVSDAVVGPATIDDWSDGIEPGDRLRIANGNVATGGDSVIVYYTRESSDRLRGFATGTIPDSTE